MADDENTVKPPTTTEVEMELVSRGYEKQEADIIPPIDRRKPQEPPTIIHHEPPHHEPLPIIRIEPIHEPPIIRHHEPLPPPHLEPLPGIHEEPEPLPAIIQEPGRARYYLAALYAALSFLAKERDIVIPY